MAANDNPWNCGDYPALARRLEPAAASIVAVVGPGRGRSALDVAAGTGSVALGLADAGWQVTATDGADEMVRLGRAAAAKAGHDIAWHVADLVSQPVASSSQDLATSSFGLIFAIDPAAALEEIARVLTPAGRLVITAWTDDGYMAEMTEVMRTHLPSAATGVRPERWGSRSFVRDAMAGRFLDLEVEERTLPWSFPTARAGREWLERVSPAHIAATAAAGDAATAMMDAVEEHLAGYADRTGRVSVEAAYLVVSGRRVP